MKRYYLCFELKSDAAFSRGDGLAGEVDSEIQYDDLGCPFLSGRALKGILVNECADLLAALPETKRKRWEDAAERLFGQPGKLEGDNSLKISAAVLPEDLHTALQIDLDKQLAALYKPSAADIASEKESFRFEIMHTLTAIRTQTAMDADGVAKEHSLRTRRVILRETYFESEITYMGLDDEQAKDDLGLLAACVAAFRRAGSNRNRGLGKLKAWIEEENKRGKPVEKMIEPFLKGVKS